MAKKDDLRKVAAEELGLDVEGMADADIEAAVAAATGEEEKPKGKKTTEKRIKVIFHNQEGVDSGTDVEITVNGYRYQIKREHEVEIPPEAMHVIENAIITEFYRDTDGVIKERNRKRFNYTVLK